MHEVLQLLHVRMTRTIDSYKDQLHDHTVHQRPLARFMTSSMVKGYARQHVKGAATWPPSNVP